jgi:hypothetical protein
MVLHLLLLFWIVLYILIIDVFFIRRPPLFIILPDALI